MQSIPHNNLRLNDKIWCLIRLGVTTLFQNFDFIQIIKRCLFLIWAINSLIIVAHDTSLGKVRAVCCHDFRCSKCGSMLLAMTSRTRHSATSVARIFSVTKGALQTWQTPLLGILYDNRWVHHVCWVQLLFSSMVLLALWQAFLTSHGEIWLSGTDILDI